MLWSLAPILSGQSGQLILHHLLLGWSQLPMYRSHSSNFGVFVYVKSECGSNMDDVLLFNHIDSCFRRLSDKEEQREMDHEMLRLRKLEEDPNAVTREAGTRGTKGEL